MSCLYDIKAFDTLKKKILSLFDLGAEPGESGESTIRAERSSASGTPFRFIELCKNQGKQGITGIFELDSTKFIFKVSHNIDLLVEHEYNITQGLSEISKYCPNFCKNICITNPGNGNIFLKRIIDPLGSTTKSGGEKINKMILINEFIEGNKFYNYIKSTQVDEKILFSIIKQVLLAISIAQKKEDFTHYDLHSENILLKRCNPELVILYVIDKENQFTVPTYGYYPVIIDFGFSYNKHCNDSPMFSSLGFTEVGFTSYKFDWLSDPKLFLLTTSREMHQKRKSVNSRRLKRVVKNIFKTLNVEKNGWEKYDISASDYMIQILEKYSGVVAGAAAPFKHRSELFSKYLVYSLDIIQTLIILPLEQNYSNEKNLIETYIIFVSEFNKIEEQISCSFYNLYILKELVTHARYIRHAYMNEKTRDRSILDFKKMVLDSLDKVVKFCRPKKINYDILLCSLYLLAEQMEGIFYQFLKKQEIKDLKFKETMRLKSIDEIFCTIDCNFKSDYSYSSKTIILIIDSVKETNQIVNLNKDNISMINKMNHMLHGTFIYDTLKSK